jgi:hypothetical protein
MTRPKGKNARTCGWSTGRSPFYCVRKKKSTRPDLGFYVCDFCDYYVPRKGLGRKSKKEKTK